ncbi:MAG: moeZ 1 [Candidatus Angelobacter sp.]|jgi:rhodanese-related sulfurtransferase|nr:moeZ 1 [Candidatus Angelobacter sp.]
MAISRWPSPAAGISRCSPAQSATGVHLTQHGKGFTFNRMKHSEGFLKIVNDAKSRVAETNVEEVKKRLDRGDKFALVDVREDNEWAKGHLPGAVHLSKGIIERDIEAAVPDKNAEIILYCGGGFRSALAADNLQKMGYKKVISMDGGWRGWTEAGHPTAKE